MSTILDLALKVGLFFINMFIKDYLKRIEMQNNFTAWIGELNARSNLSADQYQNYKDQLEELKKEEENGNVPKMDK